jgi:hypothetical protein
MASWEWLAGRVAAQAPDLGRVGCWLALEAVGVKCTTGDMLLLQVVRLRRTAVYACMNA